MYLDYDYGKGKKKTPIQPQRAAKKTLQGVNHGIYQVSELNVAVEKAWGRSKVLPLPPPQPAPGTEPPEPLPLDSAPGLESESEPESETQPPETLPLDLASPEPEPEAETEVVGDTRKRKCRKAWYPRKRIKPARVWVRHKSITDESQGAYWIVAIYEINFRDKWVNVVCAPGPNAEFHPLDRIETWTFADLEAAYAGHPGVYLELWIQAALGVEVRSLKTNRLQYVIKGYELKASPETESFWRRTLGDAFDAVYAGARKAQYW